MLTLKAFLKSLNIQTGLNVFDMSTIVVMSWTFSQVWMTDSSTLLTIFLCAFMRCYDSTHFVKGRFGFKWFIL